MTANGYSEGARRELALRPQVAGAIRTIFVKINQDVHKGDLLVELDNGTHQAQVLRAGALLKRREADCDRARDVYERLRNSKTGASPADLEQARIALGGRRADRDVAEAELQSDRTELAKTRLTAPWDGRVLDVNDEPGARSVRPARSRFSFWPTCRAAACGHSWKSSTRCAVKEGQRASVTVDGLPGKDFSGRVSTKVFLRMDRDAPHSDAPGEYQDIYHRPVLIDLDGGTELPLNLRVKVTIQVP